MYVIAYVLPKNFLNQYKLFKNEFDFKNFLKNVF